MGRRYTVTESDFAIQAAMDLMQIKGASGKVLEIIRWKWRPTDNSLPTAQTLKTRCRLLPATVGDGTGGNSSPNISANDGGDAAVSFTAIARATGKATTSGTARVYDEGGAHIYFGYDEQPEKPITVKSGESFVLELTSAVIQGTPKISVMVEVEEIG